MRASAPEGPRTLSAGKFATSCGTAGTRALSFCGELKAHPKKLWGRSSRPLCRCLLQLLSASCCFSSLLSFWLPWIYSPFPFFMEFRNDDLLQLVECIESTRNEVKRKMVEAEACNDAPKSPALLTREEELRSRRKTPRGKRRVVFAAIHFTGTVLDDRRRNRT
jgi:hypothetical protein